MNRILIKEIKPTKCAICLKDANMLIKTKVNGVKCKRILCADCFKEIEEILLEEIDRR